MVVMRMIIMGLFIVAHSAAIAESPTTFQALFGAGGMIPVVAVVTSDDGKTTTSHVHPRNLALILGTGFVMYKISGKIADFLYPYILHSLPAIGSIAHAQEEHLVSQQEAKLARQERALNAQERLTTLVEGQEFIKEKV